MHPDKSAYFTSWSSVAILLCAARLWVSRGDKAASAGRMRLDRIAACYLVLTSVLLGVVGSDVVAHRLKYDVTDVATTSTILRTHLLQHMFPMVLSMALLMHWKEWVGEKPTKEEVGTSLCALGAFFVVWMLHPLSDTGERGLCKFGRVYDVDRPATYVAASTVVVSALGSMILS